MDQSELSQSFRWTKFEIDQFKGLPYDGKVRVIRSEYRVWMDAANQGSCSDSSLTAAAELIFIQLFGQFDFAEALTIAERERFFVWVANNLDAGWGSMQAFQLKQLNKGE